jgi:hypothetical protein
MAKRSKTSKTHWFISKTPLLLITHTTQRGFKCFLAPNYAQCLPALHNHAAKPRPVLPAWRAFSISYKGIILNEAFGQKIDKENHARLAARALRAAAKQGESGLGFAW